MIRVQLYEIYQINFLKKEAHTISIYTKKIFSKIHTVLIKKIKEQYETI